MKERENPRETLPETGVAWFILKKKKSFHFRRSVQNHLQLIFRTIHYLKADAKSGRTMG